MVDFSIQFEECQEWYYFINEYKQRLNLNTFMSGRLFEEKGQAFFHIKPLVFPIYYFAFFIWGGGFLLWGFNWPILIIGAVPFLTYPLYNRWWYILCLYIGLRKNKYRGKFRVL